MTSTRFPLWSLIFLVLLPDLAAQSPVGDFKPGSKPISVIRRTEEREGITVEFTVHQADIAKVSQPLREGDNAIFTFKISDKATGQPLSNAYPAAWMAAREASDSADPDICMKKAKTLISGNIFSKAELDLNVYFVLTLNDDNTLSVVDPLFGFGTTKLLNLIQMNGRGYDWALTPDEERLFVSIREMGQVAVVETRTWSVVQHITTGDKSGRTLVQPDGQYLWVAEDGGENPGVTAVVAASLKIVAHIPTGHGIHDLAISPDNRYLWVTNSEGGDVSVIDTRSLKKVKDIKTGKLPISIAYSTTANAAYISHQGDGTVVVIDGKSHEITSTMNLEPGLGHLSFAPGGRHGFVVNPQENTIHVLDVASNRFVQTGDMDDQPDQITYSDGLAYIRQRGSATVWMVPLGEIGVEGKPLGVVDFPGGQEPPGKMAWPTPAAGMVQATGSAAMLVANPGDKSIYFYKEGMAAPMGNFTNYGRQPRAVLAIDRSLQERRPGAYQTVANLPSAGQYDMVFFMDSPRMVLCFDLEVAPDPILEAERAAVIEIISGKLSKTARVGEKVSLSFQIKQHGVPMSDLQDVGAMIYLTPGIWHERPAMVNRGDGVYSVEFTPPQTGYYYASIASPSLGFDYNNSRYQVIKVEPALSPDVAK